MGYSCRRDAADAETAVLAAREDQTSGNAWSDDSGHNCFVDRGREQDDGAITGQVFRSDSPCSYEQAHLVNCSRAGGVRIEGNGFITRWARASRGMRAAIKAHNAAVLLYRPAVA